jgi:hypothetical protein
MFSPIIAYAVGSVHVFHLTVDLHTEQSGHTCLFSKLIVIQQGNNY